MSSGEVQKQTVLYFQDVSEETVRPDLIANPFKKCCVDRVVLADIDSSDTGKNDFAAPIVFAPIKYTVAISLEEKTGDAWAKIADLNDSTYGTLYNYREKNNVKPASYRLEWKRVLEEHGSGCYRIAFDLGVRVEYSDEYTLKQYTQEVADESVRFEFIMNSVIGSKKQGFKRDFVGLNHTDQIRIYDSSFGKRTADIEVESVRLNSGKERTYKKEFREKYELEVREIRISTLKALLYDMLMADEIKATDYNSDNEDIFVDHEVEIEGSFEPEYHNGTAKQSVVLNFVDKFNNHRKLYS